MKINFSAVEAVITNIILDKTPHIPDLIFRIDKLVMPISTIRLIENYFIELYCAGHEAPLFSLSPYQFKPMTLFHDMCEYCMDGKIFLYNLVSVRGILRSTDSSASMQDTIGIEFIGVTRTPVKSPPRI